MSNRRPFDEMDSMMSRMFRNTWGDLGHNLGLDRNGVLEIHVPMAEMDAAVRPIDID